MNCQEARELLEDALDRRLIDTDKSALDLHLSRCTSCRAFFAAEKREHELCFRALNGGATAPRLSPDFADRLAANARLSRRAGTVIVPLWFKRAAVFALLLGGAAFAALVGVDAVSELAKGDEMAPVEQEDARPWTPDSGCLPPSSQAASLDERVEASTTQTAGPTIADHVESHKGESMNRTIHSAAVSTAASLATAVALTAAAAPSCIVSGDLSRNPVSTRVSIDSLAELDARLGNRVASAEALSGIDSRCLSRAESGLVEHFSSFPPTGMIFVIR